MIAALVGRNPTRLSIWEVRRDGTYAEPRTASGPIEDADDLSAIALTPEGRLLVGRTDGWVGGLEMASGRWIGWMMSSVRSPIAAVGGMGSRIAALHADGTLETSTGGELVVAGRRPGLRTLGPLMAHPAAKFLIGSNTDGRILLWSLVRPEDHLLLTPASSGFVAESPTGEVQGIGVDLREAIHCGVAHLRLPFDVCRERFECHDLLRRLWNGEPLSGNR